MKLVRVGAGVLNQTPLDWDENTANIVGAVREARARGVAVLCLPELCITGYGCEDTFASRGVQERALAVLGALLGETKGMVVSVGLPVMYRNALYNAAALLVDGALAGIVPKHHLAGEGLHYEPRWFKAWPEGVVGSVEVGGKDYPIGDVFFDVGGVKIGFEVCEDAWVANRPGAALSRHGVDLIMNPSASHFAFGKLEVRKRFVIEGSRAFGVTYVYSNYLGNEAGRAIYDGGALIATGGELAAEGKRFGYRDFEVTSAVVDIDATRTSQARTHSFEPSFEASPRCVKVGFEYPETAPETRSAARAGWEASGRIKEEEFTRAIALGLFDYMRKSRAKGFVLSLSGGADSSAVASLVSLMVRLALGDVGDEAFRAKVAYMGLEAGEWKGYMGRLLTTVFQGTRNSSKAAKEAARAVAAAVGARHMEFDVDRLVAEYTAMVEGGIGRGLKWETDDVTLQNIQARARGPGVWMVANVLGALLVATSNRSEAAVGYATMDGDTCGGLSPLAGIDKAFIRVWLEWLRSEGPEGIGAMPELECVTAQQPTPELRPLAQHQTTEGDLMPYVLLEAIEDSFIGAKRTPAEILTLMEERFPAYTRGQLGVWIERFFRLWCRNQWKRERYAPSFHVDDKNVDPKTWCRFPILSGGFEAELAELRKAAAKA
jgi:NAD+ synthase (glutamine-hydrolysing)